METKTRKSVCEIHGEYDEVGMLMEIIGMSKMKWMGCPVCAKQRAEESEKTALANRFIGIMRNSGIPSRFRDKEMASYQCEPANNAAYAMVSDYIVDPIKTREQGRCLIIIGDYGTGKTHLAVGIIKAFAMAGISALYTTADGMIRGYKESYTKSSGLDETTVFSHYANRDLLVIDELGYQRGSEEDRRIVTNIMDARYGAMRCTVIISNLTMAQVSEELGDRVIDRMREGGGKLAVFKGASKRAGV